MWCKPDLDGMMRGKAGERQVPGDISVALTHNVGGTGNTCVVHIYQKN